MEELKGSHNLPYLCSPRDLYEKFFERKLGINSVYALFHKADFPRVVCGRKFFVTRPAFLAWWEQQQTKQETKAVG